MKIKPSAIFKRQIALPSDHGSWVFLLSPLLIGLFAGDAWDIRGTVFLLLCLSAFLIRQPISMVIKMRSGRRSQKEMPAAIFWTFLYLVFVLIFLGYLIVEGFFFIIYLAVPGVLVFSWYLYLLGKRAERK
jgi:hypothetical protein